MKIKSKNADQNIENSKKGFSLIELLVAVLIVGILAMIAIPQYIKAIDKVKFSQLIIATTAIAKAEERYYMQRDEYTGDLGVLDISIADRKIEGNGSGSTNIIKFDWGVCLISNTTSTLIPHCRLYNPKVFYEIVTNKSSGRSYQECVAETSSTRAMKLCRSVMPNAKETFSEYGYCGYPCTKFRY